VKTIQKNKNNTKNEKTKKRKTIQKTKKQYKKRKNKKTKNNTKNNTKKIKRGESPFLLASYIKGGVVGEPWFPTKEAKALFYWHPI